MWDQLEAMCMEQGIRPIIEQPPGSFTAAQYARRFGINPSSARARLMMLKDAGKLEYVGRGLNNADFYRIKK